MNSSIRQELEERWDKRIEDQKAILYDYYKNVKHMCNEDARSAVDSHFTWPKRDKSNDIFELTKHWSDLNNER